MQRKKFPGYKSFNLKAVSELNKAGFHLNQISTILRLSQTTLHHYRKQLVMRGEVFDRHQNRNAADLAEAIERYALEIKSREEAHTVKLAEEGRSAKWRRSMARPAKAPIEKSASVNQSSARKETFKKKIESEWQEVSASDRLDGFEKEKIRQKLIGRLESYGELHGFMPETAIEKFEQLDIKRAIIWMTLEGHAAREIATSVDMTMRSIHRIQRQLRSTGELPAFSDMEVSTFSMYEWQKRAAKCTEKDKFKLSSRQELLALGRAARGTHDG